MVTLFRDQIRSGVLAVGAPLRTDAFDNEELDLLQRLIPHLRRASQATLKLAHLDALRSAGFGALDHLNEGVLLSIIVVVFAIRATEARCSRGLTG